MSETRVTARAHVARAAPRVRAWLAQYGLLAALTLALALWTLHRILQATAGEPSGALDDSFIHFQYARSFAELRPFEYSPGAAPAPGATSLLWPLMLALPYALGLREEHLLWAAWLYSYVALGFLAHETSHAARGLTSRTLGVAAGGMVLAFGAFTWFAASGMEVVPLAWLLMRSARRAAEWVETPAAARPRPTELLWLAFGAAAMRPEGVIAAVTIGGVLLATLRGRSRALGLLSLAAPLLPPLVNFVFTGQAASTTAVVKWLPLSPYQNGLLLASVRANVELLFGTLLDGRVWSAVFLPSGIGWLSFACLPALFVAGVRRDVPVRGVLLGVLALGMLIPTTYDSFLWNRLRYLWPFAPAWFVGAMALVDLVIGGLARLQPRAALARPVVAGALVGGLAGHLPYALDDVAESANAIRRQQVALGRWARDALPPDAVIGVNDTGAIAYFSGKRIFDVVGLTTLGEGRYWVAGAGSRFEHYERLGVKRLPTHFIVYPEWFALPALEGEWLTERRVSATILGGETMVATKADWSTLGSGERPREAPPGQRLVDSLDVADLESEAIHGYQLYSATQAENVAIESEDRVDGARRARTRDSFRLDTAPGGVLIARLGSDSPCRVELSVAGRALGAWLVQGDFHEQALAVPPELTRGVHAVELTACEEGVTSLHYWSFAP
jgi:hypothetical protein